MKQLLICFCISVFFSANAQDKNEQTIRGILSRQTADWNRGNLEAFMKGYWESDSLLFIGKNGPKYGYRAALESYRKGYPDTAAMGKLGFNILQVKPLSPDTYFVLGKWMLQRTIGNVEGHFTLLFRRIRGQWVIVADHSS
ncbi:MAG: L-asparaginase [Sediminibacterium sp.]|nr:L-asparaginase [Sediminibacterium sp.]